MKDISEHIKDTAAKATVEETNKVQTAEVQRLGEMLCGMLSAKQFSEVVETVRKPEKMTYMLLQGLKACGLLLENEGTVGTLNINVKLDMYPAPRNLDEELDRLAEKYGTEYLAEHLLNHPSDLASIQMAKAESEYMRGRHSRRRSGHRSRKEPHVGRHTAIFVEHVISDRLAMEAMAELKAAVPTEDLDTGEPTLPEACVVDVLQRFLLAGEYFSPEIGASPTLKLAIADAITYVKELMDLRKVLAAQEDDGK